VRQALFAAQANSAVAITPMTGYPALVANSAASEAPRLLLRTRIVFGCESTLPLILLPANAAKHQSEGDPETDPHRQIL